MSKFYDDTMQGLLEAIEIEKGSIPLTEREWIPEPTYYIFNNDKELVDKLIEIRKNITIEKKVMS